MKPQEYSLYRMITCIWQLNNTLETVIFLEPTYVGCTALAIKVGLLSHTSRIYIDSLQQKQAILRLFEPYWTILLMRDTRFLVV